MTNFHNTIAGAPADTYAILPESARAPVGHTTSLPAAVAALAVLLRRPAEDLYTEQPGAFGGWLVRDAAGSTVGAIALAAAAPSSAP